MWLPILAAAWLLAGDSPAPSPDTLLAEAPIIASGPVPARLPGDPIAPQLPPVDTRGPVTPAPLPVERKPSLHELTAADLRKMSILPTASLLTGIATPIVLGSRGGRDWGTPATELAAGWGGAYAGISTAIALTGIVETLGPVPDPKVGFNRGAAAVAGLGVMLLPPAGAGLAAFYTGEGMQGRSRHRGENLAAAMGGALAAELLAGGAAIGLHQPPGPAMTMVFVPIAAGATLGYDLARGPHRGPRRAMLPLVVVRF